MAAKVEHEQFDRRLFAMNSLTDWVLEG